MRALQRRFEACIMIYFPGKISLMGKIVIAHT